MDQLQLKGSELSGIVPKSFYHPNTLDVAIALLGKILVVRLNQDRDFDDPEARVTAVRIVETEAYRATDPASHASRGKTPRCAPMFEDPGIAYVYFIYGMYEMLNFVTEPEGQPGAVLIRAAEPLFGTRWMRRWRRGVPHGQWTSGPGKLTKAMSIRMKHNCEPLVGPQLYVLDDGFKAGRISMSPRVGIREATEKNWRFFLKDHAFVSRVKENLSARPLRLGAR